MLLRHEITVDINNFLNYFQPIFTDYKGFANIEYGCGICVSGKDTTCEECTNTNAASR